MSTGRPVTPPRNAAGAPAPATNAGAAAGTKAKK